MLGSATLIEPRSLAIAAAAARIPGATGMVPEGSVHGSRTFTEKHLPSFDGRTSYAVYRLYVEIQLCLTSVEEKKRGPALIGRLSGEAKASAKTQSVAVIAGQDDRETILENLNKSHAVDAD